MPPNFYYDQEDHLRERQRGKDWAFTALRPEAVCGFAVGNPMNLSMVIAVYAAISKELGIPLRFRDRGGLPGALSGHVGGHPGGGRGLGRADSGGAERDLQHHQRRLFPLAAHVAEDRAHVRHGLGRSGADAADHLHDRQGPVVGVHGRQVRVAADRLREDRLVGVRRFHLQQRLRQYQQHHQGASGRLPCLHRHGIHVRGLFRRLREDKIIPPVS